ncbi:MAG: AAA family ATPase, partial [Clostridia bacterium]|nr:AAA family ATPase [Clostridia bacterium]
MYLKSIEIQGFKSFLNKTTLKFNEGVTGIVGPNGSGKSNISDAVRWVLGEQKVRQLRGSSMQDVIFAGTELRKPLGFAFVALTLDNSDRVLNVDFEEITVSRRLFRSGESEYMLNGHQVRLKDIQDIFYDTGIGKEGYSIIGQGQIEAILNGRPSDRRGLFDEAAGIVKFKHRRLIAERKLESERQSLLRITDILSELSSRVGPLKKQSEAAREYLRIYDDLKLREVNLFIREADEILKTAGKLEESIRGTEEALAEKKTEADGLR